MKTYNNLWDILISDENISKSIHKARLGNKSKKFKKKIQYMEEHKDIYIPYFRDLAEHFQNAEHEPRIIYDGITRKQRTIIVPTAQEQVMHHMIVNTLNPMFMKSMYRHTYGSIPKRGCHLGKKRLRKWLPSKYVLKLDVHHFFDSVDQDILIEKLRKKIKDEKVINLCTTVIRVLDHGIPLGFFTSQWFANFYLTDLDHYIADELGYGHMMRYMDDIVVLSSNKKELHKLVKLIEKYLNESLNLTLKGNWQIFRFDYCYHGKSGGRCIDFMGYKFYRDRIVLRKTIMMKATRKARRIAKKDTVTWYDSAQMLSYCGYFKHTDTYDCFQKYIKPNVNVKRLKHKVSIHSKKLAKGNNNERVIDSANGNH